MRYDKIYGTNLEFVAYDFSNSFTFELNEYNLSYDSNITQYFYAI